jgi:hypothetical protein
MLMQVHTSAIFALVNRNIVLGLHEAAGAAATTSSNGAVAKPTPPGGERNA